MQNPLMAKKRATPAHPYIAGSTSNSEFGTAKSRNKPLHGSAVMPKLTATA